MIPNYDVALVNFANSLRGRPWEWGSTDCASVVRACLGIIHGRDVWPYVDLWTNPRDALRILDSYESVEAALRVSGAVPVEEPYSKIGDVILAPMLDTDGLPRFSLILPGAMVITSIRDEGVWIGPRRDHGTNATYWRYLDG